MRKRNSNEEVLINKINDVIDNPDITNSQYYNKDEFNEAIKHCQDFGAKIFHMNISSLSYHFDNLHTLLASLELKFDILGITETRLKKIVKVL